MFNAFEQDKNFLKQQYQEHHWTNGLACQDLTAGVKQIIQEYETVSVAEAKAAAIAYVLRHAQIDINPRDIFADQINHGEVMQSYLAEKQLQLKNAVQKNADSFSACGAFDANMDFGHISPDWDFLMKNGLVGVIERLEKYRTLHGRKAAATAFYENSLTVYHAMLDLFLKMADTAEKIGTAQTLFVAQNLRQLTRSAPQTLAQAMQLTLIVYSLQTHLDAAIVRSLGGLDHLYDPFYKSDLESGRFTEGELREIIRYFLWKISAMKVTANTPFYLCGKDQSGQDQTNEFTYLLLEEYRALDIYDPKMHILYHPKLPEKITDTVLEMIREGKNSFVFINTDAASAALEKIGIEPTDARRLTVYGCYEPAAEGTEIAATCGGELNLAKAVELALYNGVDPTVQKQIGPATGEDFGTFPAFLNAVKKQLQFLTTQCMDIISAYEPHYRNVCPSPIMSATFQSSVEQGKDLFNGGAKYNNTSIVGAGIATLADSCMAVKKMVFDEKKVRFGKLKKVLLNNWQGQDDLRFFAQNRCPKYGNNHPEADAIAVSLFELFANLVNNRKNGRGGVFRCGLFSVDWRFRFGEKTGATPDGRKRGEAISKNACASLCQDKNGVTALMHSVLKLAATKIPDGCVTDIVLHHSAVRGEDGMQAFKGLLKAFMRAGGASVHFNVLNPVTLKEAQKHPENYQNLQVRLCGWNVCFVDLSRAEQDEFILQSENG